jgi:hypothetical protein
MATITLTKTDAVKLATVIRLGLSAVRQETHTRDVAVVVANKLASSDGAVVIETDVDDIRVLA